MLTGRPAAWAQSLAIPSRVTARSLTQLKMLPLAAAGFSTARVSMEDRSLTWAMLVSCIPDPGIGTGLSRTIPVQSGSMWKWQGILKMNAAVLQKVQTNAQGYSLTVKEPLLTIFVVSRSNHVLRTENCPAAENLWNVCLHPNVTGISFNNVLW